MAFVKPASSFRTGEVVIDRVLKKINIFPFVAIGATTNFLLPASASQPPAKCLPIYQMSTNSSPSVKGSLLKPAFFKPKLVIFDKDGTLVCFHTMWTPWCTSLAQRWQKRVFSLNFLPLHFEFLRMQSITGMDLADPLYDVLGYDHSAKKVRIGALAENTHPQIREQIESMLQDTRGFSASEARNVVDRSWKDTPENLEIKMTGDLCNLFEDLQREDVKIAICTSDSREGTLEFLERERLGDLVDEVVCGDDSFSKPKPDPHNAKMICQRLGVKPSETIMVGDTPADTLMGQQAKLGLTVGVLTGVGAETDLADADVIVKDVRECVEMILPPANESSARRRVHQVTARGLSKIANGSWFGSGFNSSSSGGDSRSRAFSTSAGIVGNPQKEFSHIIVGAGSAGCVLANRITEDRDGS